MTERHRERRRLPVLPARPPEEEHARRPGWHWSVVVALGTLFGWLSLEMVAVGPILRGLGEPERGVLPAIVHLGALAVPAGGSAALAGRLGERARAWHAGAGALGLIAVVSAVSLARLGGGAVWAIATLAAALVALASALAGFALGRRRPSLEA